MISWLQFVDILSIVLVFVGTYLITKISFVQLVLEEYKTKHTLIGLNWFLKLLCRGYSISEKKCKTYVSGKKRAVTLYEPFVGFFYISIGLIIQLCRVFLR